MVILSSPYLYIEGIYIDNRLIIEGHPIDNRFYFLELAEKYGFTYSDVIEKTLNDFDEDLVNNNPDPNHSFPQTLDSLSGNYSKV